MNHEMLLTPSQQMSQSNAIFVQMVPLI